MIGAWGNLLFLAKRELRVSNSTKHYSSLVFLLTICFSIFATISTEVAFATDFRCELLSKIAGHHEHEAKLSLLAKIKVDISEAKRRGQLPIATTLSTYYEETLGVFQKELSIESNQELRIELQKLITEKAQRMLDASDEAHKTAHLAEKKKRIVIKESNNLWKRNILDFATTTRWNANVHLLPTISTQRGQHFFSGPKGNVMRVDYSQPIPTSFSYDASEVHSGKVKAASLSRDREKLFLGGKDGQLSISNNLSSPQARVVRVNKAGHWENSEVSFVGEDPIRDQLLIGSYTGKLGLVELGTDTPKIIPINAAPKQRHHELSNYFITQDFSYFFVAGERGRLGYVDLANGSRKEESLNSRNVFYTPGRKHPGWIMTHAFHPTEKKVFVAGESSKIGVIRYDGRKPVLQVLKTKSHTELSDIKKLFINQAGDKLVLFDGDPKYRVLLADLNKKTPDIFEVNTSNSHNDHLRVFYSAAFTHDSKHIFILSFDKEFLLSVVDLTDPSLTAVPIALDASELIKDSRNISVSDSGEILSVSGNSTRVVQFNIKELLKDAKK